MSEGRQLCKESNGDQNCCTRLFCNRPKGHKGNHQCNGQLFGYNSEWEKVPKRKMKKGFTLVDCMIVVSVIGLLLLAAIAIPSIMNAKRKQNNAVINSDGNSIVVKIDANEAERNRYQVNYMFEVDGVKMYRFYEAGYWHYFTIAAEQKSMVLEKEDKSK